jgi:hypothetical protein
MTNRDKLPHGQCKQCPLPNGQGAKQIHTALVALTSARASWLHWFIATLLKAFREHWLE